MPSRSMLSTCCFQKAHVKLSDISKLKYFRGMFFLSLSLLSFDLSFL